MCSVKGMEGDVKADSGRDETEEGYGSRCKEHRGRRGRR